VYLPSNSFVLKINSQKTPREFSEGHILIQLRSLCVKAELCAVGRRAENCYTSLEVVPPHYLPSTTVSQTLKKVPTQMDAKIAARIGRAGSPEGRTPSPLAIPFILKRISHGCRRNVC